jgi:uncharacterized membrane protein YfcA
VWHGFVDDENALEPKQMTAILLLIGVLIGAVLGLTGAGGSVLAVPLLMLCLAVDPVTATGLALGVVAISSAYGAIQRIRHREILWIPALLFGISGMVFAPIGRWLSTQTSPVVLLGSFALLSLAIAARMLWQSIREPEQASVVRAGSGNGSKEPLLCRFSETQHFDWRLRCMAGLTSGGVLTGLLSGFFGVGGGFMIVPFLNQLNNVSMRQAVATSLVIIAGISASGFAAHVLTQSVDVLQLLLLGAGGVGGMVLGSLLAKKIAGVHLQRLFACTIVVMAIILIARGI